MAITKIGNYQAFPIYSVSFSWEQDGEHDPNYPDRFMYKDMLPGRIRNSMSHNFMFKEELNESELNIKINEFIKRFIDSKHNIQNVTNINFKFKLKYETWNLTWFQHETFDIGLTDKEYLQSFEEFVRRYEHIQNHMPGEPYPENYHCLMGAEDRWRWHGAEPNGESNDRSPAPCRCKFCKEQGMIRIAH